MKFLGIETSCDESAAAVVSKQPDGSFQVNSNVISSQADLHALYGGVVPELAAREHLKNLPLVFKKALEDAKVSIQDIDAIAVTQGPGLKGCLLIGCDFARGISDSSGVPLKGVNHIEAHVLSGLLVHKLNFPFLSLVVSGGHTELSQVNGIGDYTLLAKTGDDAAGEAFDKSATLLGLPYPGGVELSKLASSVSKSRFKLPIGLKGKDGFSFSGFKTAVSLLVQNNLTEETKPEIAWAVEEGIVSALLEKIERASSNTGLKEIVVSGGVAANKRLRERLTNHKFLKFYPVPLEFCTDNAAMIAAAAMLRFEAGLNDTLSSEVFPRWPIYKSAANAS